MLPKGMIDESELQPMKPKRKYNGPSTLGLGFDPTAINPESGFKPIVDGQGSSMPTLAFSVLDGSDRPPVTSSMYDADYLKKRQQLLLLEQLQQYQERLNQEYDSGGDRGVNPVNVPAPLLPYVASTYQQMPTSPTAEAGVPQSSVRPSVAEPASVTTLRTTERRRIETTKPQSADFSSFADSNKHDDEFEYEYDTGYHETDRIDVQAPLTIDPNALIYSQHSAPYGHQFPSYLPDSIQTMVGTQASQDASKTFSIGDSVVYGKFPEGAHASENMNLGSDEEYIDDFEYYDDDDDYYQEDNDYYNEQELQELKRRLGIAADSKPKVSFLQLLTNLQGTPSQQN
jgi:hypothetical protein